MDENQGRFCTECGYQFTEDFGFCPRCGAAYRNLQGPTLGSANVRTEAQKPSPDMDEVKRAQEAYVTYARNIQKQIMESGRKVTIVMLMCWVILSAVLAALMLALPEDVLSDLTGATGLGNEITYEGAVLLLSCILAAVSLVYVYKKQKWKVAFITCFASTLSVLLLLAVGDTTSIYLMLCGLLATLRVRNLKPLFE